MRKINAIFVCLLLLASVLGASAVVFAKKPPKPPPPPPPSGTVYFEYYDGSDYSVWTMDGDGSNKAKLILIDCEVGRLSRVKHGDHYWFNGFCTIDGEYYPDGLARQEIFAIRDDGTITVQLTNDPYLAPDHRGRVPFWGPDDETVTWPAKKWVCDPDCVLDESQAGLFNATINYDENGDITGADSPVLIWWTALKEDEGYWVPTAGGQHHWSPDGTKIARYKQGLNVLDLSEGTETILTQGWSPRWSPDGTMITFKGGPDDIRTINADGTNEQIIAEPKMTKRAWQNLNHPEWSPCGNFITYQVHQMDSMLQFKSWIYRIDVDGSGKTSLTNNLLSSNTKDNVGWR